MKNRIIEIILGAIFILAGFLKAIDPLSFYDDINTFIIFPPIATLIIALYLPYLELLCGFNLIINQGKIISLVIIWLLLISFSGLIFVSWLRGLDIRCGCFGGSLGMGNHYGLLLGRNGLLLLAASYVLFSSKNKRTDSGQ